MNKNLLKKDGLHVVSKKIIYISYVIIFIFTIFLSYLYTVYTNKNIIGNSKVVHYRNLELNEKIQLLKKDIKEKKVQIKKYTEDYKELSGIFNKYTEAVKFQIATADEIKNSLFEKDKKILELEREVNYYKFIASSKNKKDTISIENFKTKLSNEHSFIDYSFLLLSNSNKSNITGNFNFYYDGFVLNSNEAIVRKNINLKEKKLNFKNYLLVKGKIAVPENHRIKVLYLDVKCNGKIYNYKHKFIKF